MIIRTLLLILGLLSFSTAQSNVVTYFNQIKSDPIKLKQFLTQMPKGGDLHYHLAAGIYAEDILKIAETDAAYGLDIQTLGIIKPTALDAILKVKDISPQSELYAQIIKAWSMKDFVPGKESAHDHFFNTFLKFLTVDFDHRAEFVAQALQEAAKHNLLYLELMDTMDNLSSIKFGALINAVPTFDKKRALLLKNEAFQKTVEHTVLETDKVIDDARNLLDCNQHPEQKVCTIRVRFQYHSLREQAFNNVFAQTLHAFEAASRSKNNLVGVNLVQPEDGVISLRDYHQHMKLFGYMHSLYPNVYISLHAGEITPELVSAKDMRFHIRDAILTGKANRIGHGVDILQEDNAEETLQYMAKHQIAVEINLSSNLAILKIKGREHALKDYLQHHVPVVLSTDDQGVLRIDLTHEYQLAVEDQSIDYPALKLMNRNALTYAFISGKSIWANAEKAKLIPECKELGSMSCKNFIKQSPKAQLQWDLEQQLKQFEENF